MREPTSPDTLTARLAALRATASRPLSSSSPSRESAPTSPSHKKDDTAQLAERLARLRAPAGGSSSSDEAGPRVPVGFKGVEELEGTVKVDDEVERFLRQVEEEEELGQGAAGDAGAQVESILRSRSPPSGPPLDLPSPPSSPPLSRARRSIPALSPSLLDTLSGVEVQFFRPGLGDAPPPVDAGALGGATGMRDEEEELMRRVGEEGEVELRQGEADREGEEETARGWEARLKGLGGVVPGADASSGRGGGGGTAALGPGAPPPREGVDEVRRAARRGGRKGKVRSGSGSEGSSEETDSEEEDSAQESEEEEGSE
ncbi:hypothetical protein JCM8208_005295 [Rhodotorula glutinis]